MLFDPLLITYGLIGCVVILIGWLVRLEIKIRRMVRGKNGASLEDSIVSAHDNLQKLNEFQKSFY
jgi:hypothetical protein